MALIDVVKYNGKPDVFAWKYPSEELGTWTQLIVNESQEAVLYKSGKALDVFQSGRHTLETGNIPLFNELVNLPFGKRSPFTAEVWFVNKAYNLDIKWGTPSPIQLQDPRYGILVPVRSNGAFGVRIEDAKKFLVKLVGTLPVFDKTTLVKYFRSLYITKVKDAISSYLIRKQISIVEINAYIDELSSYMKERIQPVMDEYGIMLVSFYVNDISVPEEDEAVQKLKSALSKRAEMNIIGYDYRQQRSFDTLEGAAKNSGSGAAPLMGAGLGLGMGLGMGPTMGQGFGGIAQELKISSGGNRVCGCPQCHSPIPAGQRFCGVCGFDTVRTQDKKQKNETKICANCGTTITEQQKFCPECGRKFHRCPRCANDIPDGSTACPTCGYELPMTCSQCGASIPGNVKFCPECGASLAKQCPRCQTIIEGTPKFCPECGQKL